MRTFLPGEHDTYLKEVLGVCGGQIGAFCGHKSHQMCKFLSKDVSIDLSV